MTVSVSSFNFEPNIHLKWPKGALGVWCLNLETIGVFFTISIICLISIVDWVLISTGGMKERYNLLQNGVKLQLYPKSLSRALQNRSNCRKLSNLNVILISELKNDVPYKIWLKWPSFATHRLTRRLKVGKTRRNLEIRRLRHF